MTIELKPVLLPDLGDLGPQPKVPALTFEARVRDAYRKAEADWLVVYADREHFGSIAFLSGFEPRFEEAYLLLGPDDKRVLLTGNECASYAPVAALPGIEVMVAQTLSLMGQDRSLFPRLHDRFRDAGIKAGDTVGLVGWKYLEPEEDEDPSDAFFVPAAHLGMLRRAVGREGTVRDATPVLMHPTTGLMAALDADQIAAFEWTATRVSQAVWRIVSGIREGDTEYAAAARMLYDGHPMNLHPMLASAGPGESVIGLRSPSSRVLKRGDGVTTAVGMPGALSARGGLLVEADDGFLRLASGYFEGLLAWYEAVDIGTAGGTLHDAVASKLAEGNLRSALNPGHLGGHEEWINTPVRPGSTDKLASGMAIQVDVIPVPMPENWTLNCEDPVVLADAALRARLRKDHPDTFARLEMRRSFVRNQLGVTLRDSILPLSATPLCLAPFWLDGGKVLSRAG